MSRRKAVPSSVHPPGSSPQNIVVFGECGVGKSSLINLIAGRSIAATSSSAKGCTFHHKKYELQVDDTPYAIWDTAGLDEGTYGTIPAEIAEGNLKQLLRDLTRAHGVHLLMYCIRASRLRKTLLSNYNLFYSAMCRKKVPIVVVVTGLENHEGQMEDWWTLNEREFTTLKMHFDGHACITTLNTDKVNSPILKQRCQVSRQTVLSLIASACARDRWRAEQENWTLAALADVKAMFKPRHDGRYPTPIVALYDLSGHSPGSTRSVKDTSPFEGARLMDVGGSPLLIYRIRDQQIRAGARFKKQITQRGADLLIFCASIHTDPVASQQHAATFYASYGGDTRPLLIVVRDAPSDERAHEWWNSSDGYDKDISGDKHTRAHHGAGKLQAIVRALPPPGSAASGAAIVKLQRTILTRSLEPVDVVPTGCFGWLTAGRRSVKLHSGSTGGTLAEDCLTESSVWVPWHGH